MIFVDAVLQCYTVYTDRIELHLSPRAANAEAKTPDIVLDLGRDIVSPTHLAPGGVYQVRICTPTEPRRSK